jgi:hypothetical protein
MTERDDINAVAAEYVLATLGREDVLIPRAHRWRSAGSRHDRAGGSSFGGCSGAGLRASANPHTLSCSRPVRRRRRIGTPAIDRMLTPVREFQRASRSREIALMILSTARGSDYVLLGALYSRSPGFCA